LADSDEELVNRVRRGEREAFGVLVDRYERPALAVANSILHSWHDASDAVQDAFVAAYEKLNRLWSARKFGAWFLRIVRRQALWHRRRRVTQSRHLVAIGAGLPQEAQNSADMPLDILNLISRLPVQECVVVSMRHLNELSVSDIARLTGRPVGTVTKQLSRAYARLRPWLEESR
jgi:RNA polymerase sigma-70 factor, ECF subfamily